jgi:hypothetical protein
MVLLGDISAADWGKGIALSIMASLVGGASKLAIRKSWLITHANPIEPELVPIEPPIGETWTLDTNSSSSNEDGSGGNHPVATSGDELMQERKRRRRLARALRYSGMIGMSVLNPICCVLAMKYASPSILAPFSGLTMVWVILFSKLVVGEEPSKLQKVASCLIVAGEVIVACFGDHTNDVHDSTKEVVSTGLENKKTMVLLETNGGNKGQMSSDTSMFLTFPLLCRRHYFLCTAELLQGSVFSGIFWCIRLLPDFACLLDQLFQEFHASTICLGFLRWYCDGDAKLFEGFVNARQGFQGSFGMGITLFYFHGRSISLFRIVNVDCLYETL